MNFKVSIIIPVYNAEKYVETAVMSALQQEETGEVILIEDGSPDNALAICKELEVSYKKVKLLRHPNGENRGAGDSRNLGIQNARFEYIAFLDADDYMLPDRFKKTKEIFLKYSDADGVHEAIACHFENEHAKTQWFKNHKSEFTRISETIPPEKVLESICLDNYGYFSTDAITVKTKFFLSVGTFNAKLELSQDTALWLKMAALGKLYTGEITAPVAMRRVHENNRMSVSEKRIFFGIKMWQYILKWALTDKRTTKLQHELIYQGFFRFMRNANKLKRLNELHFALIALKTFPKIIFHSFFIQRFMNTIKFYFLKTIK